MVNHSLTERHERRGATPDKRSYRNVKKFSKGCQKSEFSGLASTSANSPTTISLSGSGVQPGFHSVSLDWSESSSNVFAYNIYRATISGGPYALLSLAPVTPNQYLDTDVTAGQTYYYVVTALDSMNNESTYSNEASAIIPTP